MKVGEWAFDEDEMGRDVLIETAAETACSLFCVVVDMFFVLLLLVS